MVSSMVMEEKRIMLIKKGLSRLKHLVGLVEGV
jgi:hypothetical protein